MIYVLCIFQILNDIIITNTKMTKMELEKFYSEICRYLAQHEKFRLFVENIEMLSKSSVFM